MSGTHRARYANEAVGTDTVGELAIGGRVPDFELRDHAKNQRPLSQLVAGDPTVLHFYRGWWCPKEQAFFRRLLALQEDAEVAYARIVSLSVDPPEVNAAFRAGLGARWTFLSDPDRQVQTQLRLRETTDTLNNPYVPSVFVIGPDLRIHAAYNGSASAMTRSRGSSRQGCSRSSPGFSALCLPHPGRPSSATAAAIPGHGTGSTERRSRVPAVHQGGAQRWSQARIRAAEDLQGRFTTG